MSKHKCPIFKYGIWNIIITINPRISHLECLFLEKKGNSKAKKKCYFQSMLASRSMMKGNWRLSWGECAPILDLVFHLDFSLLVYCGFEPLTDQVLCISSNWHLICDCVARRHLNLIVRMEMAGRKLVTRQWNLVIALSVDPINSGLCM